MENTRKISILQIDEIRWFNVGAWYAVSLSRGLVELGRRVVFVAKGDLPPAVAAREAGLETRSDFTFSTWRLVAESRKLAELAQEVKADVICAHRAWSMNVAIGARMMLPAPGPVIVRARIDIRPIKSGAGNRFIYRRMVDGVVTPNSVSAARHEEAMGIPPERIKTIPGGVDTEIFKPGDSTRVVWEEWGVPTSALLVGLVARLDHVKGHGHFLKAAALVNKEFPQAYFAIIGEETNVKVADLEREAEKLGIRSKVVFVGRRSDVHRCTAALDIGVIASTGSEALSRVALEYMSCELPVVATSVGGIPDVVEDSKTGLVVPPANPAAMADAIKKLIKRQEAAKSMGIEGRKRAESLYSRKALASKTADFYLELIERRLAKAKKQ